MEFTTENKGIGTDPSADGEQWYTYSVVDRSHVDNAIEVAENSTWGSKSAKERRAILEQVAAYMSTQRARSISVMARDAGKTVSEADPEVSEAIDFARFYASTIDDEKSTPLSLIHI